ncbi:unnamed protein product [Gordionus sp. m RMFG-2023]|uniref:splicing factor C9orf78 homolog n=1 Tax=Gordionus sp. m RMFG-2023 TaxID=3053472 RepID=UPI0030DE5558
MNDEVFKIKPKKTRNKQIRKTITDNEPEDDNSEAIECLKELQNLRKKARGISIETINTAEMYTKFNKSLEHDDMFKLKLGGLVDLSQLSNSQKQKQKSEFIKDDDTIELEIGTGFSKETNRRDEDAEMMKFIEIELEKRKGKAEDKSEDANERKFLLHPNDALYYVSDHLKKSYVDNKKNKSEEMMSNQMLSGIPEVNLGLETKIANIEATELEKQKVLESKHSDKSKPSSFVPANMAVNFAQHNRFKIEKDQSNLNPTNQRNAEIMSRQHFFDKRYCNTNSPASINNSNQKTITILIPVKPEPTVLIESDHHDSYIKETIAKDIESFVILKNISDNDSKNVAKAVINPVVQVIHKSNKKTDFSHKRINPEKATDDFYFERYRKQFSRF